jgi:hypothetical protein
VGSDGSAGLRAAKLPRRKFHPMAVEHDVFVGRRWFSFLMVDWGRSLQVMVPTAGVTLRAGLPEVITLILQARRE